MSKLTDDLREYLKIHNPHNFAQIGGAQIFVAYAPQENGRVSRVARYIVRGINFNTNPYGHWMDYGNKVFDVRWHSEKELMRDEALAWAAQKFNIKEWAKMPYRESWVSRDAYDRVMVLLKEAKRTRK